MQGVYGKQRIEKDGNYMGSDLGFFPFYFNLFKTLILTGSLGH